MILSQNETQKENLIKLIDELKDYAIILLDYEGNIQNWNTGAERIKGYSSEEIIGKNFRLFYTKEDKENYKPDLLIRRAKIEGVANDEGWRVRKDGSRFWGSITINAIHDDEGNVTGYGKVTRDLTAKKHAEEQLQKHFIEIENKNKELEQFAYIASHDLQEPLRSLTNFSELIKSEYQGKVDENLDIYTEFIYGASSRMRDLVKGLLDYTRIGKEKELQEIDCNKIISDVLIDMNFLIKDKKATITIDKLPQVQGYGTELRLLFQNLIGNALKYVKTDITPSIHISVKNQEKNWTFSIRDNGIGIDKNYQEKIFQIFKRLHNRNEYEGTGIGLAHCKKIVELHGGIIWVESEGNNGSTFYFTIPKI
ncbi:sensor histidine kinase [Flavobacterium sp. MAHUQ-51]|uniref:sensor histidine kinase n=1 Tax=Flavobacterium sp. GCM10022190 TaxID=3252639 RepID=UPI00361226B5